MTTIRMCEHGRLEGTWCSRCSVKGRYSTTPDKVNVAPDPANDKFVERGLYIGALTSEKNAAYGDSFARSHLILEILYPDGITVSQYSDVMALTRIIDKQFRIATRKDAFGESPYLDIGGYAVLGAVKDAAEKSKRETDKSEADAAQGDRYAYTVIRTDPSGPPPPQPEDE